MKSELMQLVRKMFKNNLIAWVLWSGYALASLLLFGLSDVLQWGMYLNVLTGVGGTSDICKAMLYFIFYANFSFLLPVLLLARFLSLLVLRINRSGDQVARRN